MKYAYCSKKVLNEIGIMSDTKGVYLTNHNQYSDPFLEYIDVLLSQNPDNFDFFKIIVEEDGYSAYETLLTSSQLYVGARISVENHAHSTDLKFNVTKNGDNYYLTNCSYSGDFLKAYITIIGYKA